MNFEFWISYRSACNGEPIDLDRMFDLAILSGDHQIFCRNQWEIDTLTGLSLIYGKELKNMLTWDQWMGLSKGRPRMIRHKLKDYIISTFDPGNRFRGL